MRYLALVGGLIVIFCGAQVRAEEERDPNKLSFGIGIGIDLPADINMPNLAVASFRYKSMEFQPFVVLSSSESENFVDDGVTTSTDTRSAKTVGAGAVFKYTFARRRHVDLQVIGSLNYARNTETVDPEGPNNRSNTEATSFELGYGLGLQWWLSSHISLMATAINPIFADITTKTTEQTIGGTVVSESSDRNSGLVWDPSISIAVMMWF